MISKNDISDPLRDIIDQLQEVWSQMANKIPYTFNEHSGMLTFDGVVSVVIFMGLMVGLAFFFYRKKKALDFCDRYLTYAFIAVWMLGFVVYDLGMYPDHSANGTRAFLAMLGVAPMAIIHAFEMFILQSDVSAIHDGCHDSAWFMFFFSIAHLLAAFISMVFVIKHFGFNIVANFIRLIKTHFWLSNVKNLYVFWGMNDATYHLAKDIIENKHASDARIFIIRVNSDKEDPNKRIGMDRLFSFLSLSNNNLDNLQELQKLGCLTSSTFGSLTEAQADSDNDLIRRELRLSSLVRLMDNTTGKVHMFFLNDDESFNIQAVGNLKRDLSINNFANQGKIKFYCRARYNSVHRVIEDEPTHQNIEVRVIDSAHLSVEMLKLKKNIHLQPVSYVNVEEDATVSTPFNALVVGFSEVGMDMVRFLYEYSAFVKTGSTNKNVMSSDFHCDVVDKDMASLAGQFVANAPAIKPRLHRHNVTNYSQKPGANKPKIDLYELDCQSVKFYNGLKDWLPTVNYIVLATGDDELNMSHAVRLFKLAIRYGTDMSRLRIMVRVRYDDNGHLKKIAEHYNRLWAAECESPDKDKRHQHVIGATKIFDGPITPFGSTESIYTFDHIVNESLKESAKRFKEKYDLSLIELQRVAGSRTDTYVSWDDEQNEFMQLTGVHKGFSPTYSGMMRLRRVQSQNTANSMHSATKVELAKRALKDEYDLIKMHGLSRKVNEIEYRWRDYSNVPIDHIQRVMDVLAQTEHLRWVASHEILGYQEYTPRDPEDPGKKDEARLLHGYMCDWDMLSTETKSYDYNAVDVSISEYGYG